MEENDFLMRKLSELKISELKQKEILKNNKISHALSILFKNNKVSKLHYNVAAKIPSEINNEENLLLIGNLIENEVIRTDKACLGIFYYLEKSIKNTSPVDFLHSFEKTDDEILEIIKQSESVKKTKKDLSKYLNNHETLRFTDPACIIRVIDDYLLKMPIDNTKSDIDPVYQWIMEGELSRIHMPSTNPLNDSNTLDSHLKRTGGVVITRFPPEPNGFLHIGHAKALNLSYNFMKMHKGEFILRYDDTNPRNEKELYYKNILDDCMWLLGDGKTSPFTKITHASDYFDQFIEFGFMLIKKGKAFVCNQTQEEMRKSREINEDSPFRKRSIDENIGLFKEMIEGKWREGTISLRLKMNMQSKNPLMHDLVAFRVVEEPHYKTKDKYKVYPSYDFTHCINDSIEDITHSFCSREFFNRKESYYWVLNELEIYKPVQWEFSRLNIEDTMLSKRKIVELIETGVVSGWDDPRLYTLSALRRRGFTADGINKFIKSIGVTFNVTTIELKALENFIREDLLIKATKINCVVDPIKVEIRRDSGSSEIIYIDKSDFSTTDDGDFYRLTPKQPVGLFNHCTIHVVEYSNDLIIAKETDAKPKKYIHFVKEFISVKLRFYDKLFIDGKLNENSCINKIGYCDKKIQSASNGDLFQFIRVGFFCVDIDSKADNIILNLTLPLKNSTWVY